METNPFFCVLKCVYKTEIYLNLSGRKRWCLGNVGVCSENRVGISQCLMEDLGLICKSVCVSVRSGICGEHWRRIMVWCE